MDFKEEWLFPNAVVPVDATTTRLLVEQLKTMLVTIGQIVVEQQPAAWVGLTDEAIWLEYQRLWPFHPAEEPTLAKDIAKFARAIESKLKEKNT